MAVREANHKERWTTNKLIEEIHHNLITIIGENGLRKYEEQAKFLLYRIPLWRDPKTGDHKKLPFVIGLEDVSEKVKEEITNISDRGLAKTIVKESVSLIFENLGPKEKEYFNKNVRHLLKVVFV